MPALQRRRGRQIHKARQRNSPYNKFTSLRPQQRSKVDTKTSFLERTAATSTMGRRTSLTRQHKHPRYWRLFPNANHKPILDATTLQVIQIELQDLVIAATNNNQTPNQRQQPTLTRRTMATILLNSRLVLKSHLQSLYSLDNNTNNNTDNNWWTKLQTTTKNSFADMQRRYQLVAALNELQMNNETCLERLESWSDIVHALQDVFELSPHALELLHTLDNDNGAHNENDPQQQQQDKDDDQLLSPVHHRLSQLSLLQSSSRPSTIGLRPSQHYWQQLAHAKLLGSDPPPEPEPTVPAIRPLTDEERRRYESVLRGGHPEEVVATLGQESVLRRSLATLQPGIWLNDQVISFYLSLLSARDTAQQNNNKKRSHFFNSFFVTKLLDEGGSNQYSYKNVKRWSKKVPGKDLFALKRILFPINQNNSHWTCAVADMEACTIQYYDSLGGSGLYYLQNLLRYFQDEHQAKHHTALPNLDDWQLIACTDDTPRQLNTVDCGVFTCLFCDFCSAGRPLTFGQEDILAARERIALSILTGQIVE